MVDRTLAAIVKQYDRQHSKANSVFGWTSLTGRDMVERILIRNWPRFHAPGAAVAVDVSKNIWRVVDVRLEKCWSKNASLGDSSGGRVRI